MAKKEPLNDVFEDAAKAAINKAIKPIAEVNEKNIVVETKSQEEQAMELTVANGETSWSKFKGKINGAYAERMMDVLDGLPDREFARIYPKLLEYVNPKVVRKEVREEEEENKTIKVTIYQQNNNYPDNEEKIIDVTES